MQTRRSFLSAVALLAGLRCEAQERLYVVYFRWNSTVLLPNMERLVLVAAQAAKLAKRVDVTGYADTSLSDAESLDISNRMAKTVADELVRRGVSAETIMARGLGEVNLAKATADGVMEPYNRRVEIIIR